MNWDAIGAIAEVVGALGVLASLIYLAIQIRHNSSSVDASTEDGVVSGFNEINLVIGADPATARVFMTGLNSPGELDEHESTQFFFLMSSFVNQYSRLCVLFLNGSFSADRWDTYAKELASLIATPGGKEWKDNNPHFSYLWDAVEGVSAELDFNVTPDRSSATADERSA